MMPDADIIRAAKTGLRGQIDPFVLEFAAQHRRILLTHDVNTIHGFAYQRVLEGKSMPGVVVVPQNLGIAPALDDLHLLAECGCPED